jgi:hypothetical protein
LDLESSDVCYKYTLQYEGNFDDSQPDDLYIEHITILPNYNVYLETGGGKYSYYNNFYNNKFTRYKIDLPESLAKELIEYANKQDQ